MKKNVLFSVLMGLALVVTFSSCEKDEDKPIESVLAKFSATSTNDFTVPSEVTFTDESVVPESAGTPTYAWDFGDGGTSTEKSPKHTYNATGSFTVKLTITSKAKPSIFELDVVIKAGELFSEDFETFNGDGDNLPSTWVVINNDASMGNDDFFDKAWKIYSSTRFGSKVVGATSWNKDEDISADDWLILPGIDIIDKTFLRFQAMSLTSSGKYKDDYEVYISTTTQDIAGCKASTGKLVKYVEQELTSTLATTPGTGPATHEIDLSEFNGKKVFIAFRLMTPSPGGDELGIDNISVYVK